MAAAAPLPPTASNAHVRGKPPDALIVAEHLEDTLCHIRDDVLFECRIDGPYGATCTWYKNGSILRNTGRFRMFRFKNWHRLEIKGVRDVDQGVYCIICENEVSQAFTKAILFVETIRVNEVAYYMVNPHDCTRILRHLSPVVVNVGERVELLLVMETYVHVKHYWYKDDVEISPNDRIRIVNTNSIANMVIEQSQSSDAGIYVLVMVTQEGVLSSYAGVNVLRDIDLERLMLPAITEHLTRDVEVVENQYIKLMCRGIYDIHTKVQWYMNDILIDDYQVLQHDFSNGYVALKILDTFQELSARYRVVLLSEKTNKIDISTCNLTIYRSLCKTRPRTDVVKPLESAVASYGSKVVFDCVFSYDNHQKLQVIWFVGRYRVERSSNLFGVICKGGTFILHIKKMTIGMAGEVVCEIHQWQHSQDEINVAQSIANLTMVPPGFLEDGMGDQPSKLFRRGSHKAREITEELGARPLSTITQICMRKPIKFKFCKLDDEGYYYFFTKPRDDVKIFYNHPNKLAPRKKKDVSVFQWIDETLVGAWYSVAFQTEEGPFKEFGIGKIPRLEVQGPPVERMLIFTITPIRRLISMYRPLVCFRINHELELKVHPMRRVRHLTKFDTWYIKYEELIGGGAFGNVSLIEDDYSDSYAAKFIKLRARNRQDMALREFYMLRKLLDTNVVGVVDAYTSPEMVIIVMEYVWGGELFERIVRDPHINEADVALCVKQICFGLAYIHSLNVVHLDLKPENIVFAHPNSMVVKLVDFGLARVLFDGSKIKAIYGTREYVAPEVLNFEPVNLNSDMWSLGVVIYMMLSGSMPFDADTEADQTLKIISAQYNYDDPAFRTISDVVKDFIDHLLVVHPRRRFKAEDALKHPWIVDGPPKGSTTGAMKISRAKLKVYMEICKAKWQGRVYWANSRS